MTLRNLCLGLAVAAALLTSAGCNLCRKNCCNTSCAPPCCAPAGCATGACPTPATAYSPGPAGCCNGR